MWYDSVNFIKIAKDMQRLGVCYVAVWPEPACDQGWDCDFFDQEAETIQSARGDDWGAGPHRIMPGRAYEYTEDGELVLIYAADLDPGEGHSDSGFAFNE